MPRIYKKIVAAYVIFFSLIFFARISLSADGDIVAELMTRQERIITVEAPFIQEKHARLLKKPITTEGRLLYRKPDRIRWEYRGSMKLDVIFDGKDLWLYYPDLKEAERISGMAGYTSLMQFDISSLSRNYTVEARKEKQQYFLRFVARAGGPIRRIEMVVQEETAFPQRVTLFDANNEPTIITFTNVKINRKIAGDPFRFVPGPEITVREQKLR